MKKIDFTKVYGYIGKVLCGVAGGIVGLISGGIVIAVVGVFAGILAGHYLEKAVIHHEIKK